MNFTCVICSDLFVPSDDIHITPCGHIFHHTCLLQWLERSKTCPQCRNRCIEQKLVKVYLTIAASHDNPDDQATLVDKLDTLTLSVREQVKTIKALEDKNNTQETQCIKLRKMVTRLSEKVTDRDLTITMYKVQLDTLKMDNRQFISMKEELKDLREKVRLLRSVEIIVDSTSKDVDEILMFNDDPRSLAISLASLKRELQASEQKMKDTRSRINSLQNDLSEEREKRTAAEDRLAFVESELTRAEEKIKQFESNTTGSDAIILNTPEQQSKRRREEECSPTAVQKILDSDSPYFRLKSCALGLLPKFKPGLSASAASSSGISKTLSDPSHKYSIFQSRPADALRYRPGEKENVKLDPSIKLVAHRKIIKIKRFTTSARVKSGQLSKHPSTVSKLRNRTMDDYLAEFPSKEDFV